MISVLTALMPVLLIIAVGILLRKRKFLSETTVSELKRLLTGNILPVVIFNALATADFSGGSWGQIGIILIMLCLSFGLGFLLRPLLKPPFRKYVPFLVSVYEGGMIALPLYTRLCGSENVSRLAVLDIACAIFGFGFYMNMLSFEESGEKPNLKKVILSALKSPVFDAAILGLLAGCSGWMGGFLESGAGKIYSAIVEAVSAPLVPMILLVVGYNIQSDRTLLVPCLKTIGLRVLVQGIMAVLVLLTVHRLIGQDPLTDKAILIYMSAPPSYSLQSFIKDPRGANYASTVNALYIFVSIAVFAVIGMIG